LEPPARARARSAGGPAAADHDHCGRGDYGDDPEPGRSGPDSSRITVTSSRRASESDWLTAGWTRRDHSDAGPGRAS
jgi:hypothetical protein